ncbi:MAG TPA: hypothetical protein VHQ65_08040, partial [Thermoanaerobaculia bacterium]|nr:hypothetical protein [Thermoanaerobaculia bacterium]
PGAPSRAGGGATRIDYDAELALRGPLALANPLLGPVLRRTGDDAVAGLRRVLALEAARVREESRPRLAGSLPPPADTPAGVDRIVALDDRPVLRNLLITASYHRLAVRLAAVLGRDDATWCCFGAWASKTAGAFIREEELCEELRSFLLRKGRLRRRLQQRLGHGGRGDRSLLAIARAVSRHVRQGNRIVFAELGRLFAELLIALEAAQGPGDGRLEALIARLRPGESLPDRLEERDGEPVGTPQGGQDLLVAAMRCFWNARFETDPKRRAEQVLYGNALAGLHEQTRLQPYIAGALAAPVRELLDGGLLDSDPGAGLGELGDELVERIRAFSTLYLMRTEIPGEALQLGMDLPTLAGGAPYPPHLAEIADAELAALLAHYGADPRAAGGIPLPLARLRARLWAAAARLRIGPARIAGTAATDWGELADRMRYIFAFFRSRQCQAALLEPPFTPEQEAALAAGRIPAGAL